MRIGILCHPSIGGSGLVATELGVNLARQGHEIHFISHTTPFKMPRFERNISFHSVDPINYPLFNQTLYTFALSAKIIEVAEDFNLDLVHAHYSIPHSLCAHLAREISGKKFRIVTTLHGTDVTIVGQDRPLYPINRYGIEQSDCVSTVSQYQKQHTLEHFRISKEIRVIYNFIDPEVFKPGNANPNVRACLADDDERIVMHISNFRKPKNPIGLVKTFALAAQRIKARLVLIGDGPDILEIKHVCQDLGICEKVSFMGRMDNVENVIPAADCILNPSYREAFGMVLLEAMACGVPTVSSNVDGIPEVVVHGETGFMAGPDEHEALAEYVVKICRDEALAKRLGENGRRRAVSVFHKDLIVPQYLECYESGADDS